MDKIAGVITGLDIQCRVAQRNKSASFKYWNSQYERAVMLHMDFEWACFRDPGRPREWH